MRDVGEVVVRTTTDQQQATEWVAVLGAADIQARVDGGGEQWALLVAEDKATQASEVLAEYDAEASAAPVDDGIPEWGSTDAGLFVAAVVLVFPAITGFRSAASSLFLAGAGKASAIVDGEYWRTVTALMLHADMIHLLGNVVALVVLATAVCRQLGPGLGVVLMLAAGATGNGLDAWLSDPSHTAVGASTAVFGALGLLAGLAMLRSHTPGRRAWVPFAAALALLGFLGTGARADLVAHFFGFQAGLGLGMATAMLIEEPPGLVAQRWLAAVSAGVVVLCWLLALRSLRGG